MLLKFAPVLLLASTLMAAPLTVPSLTEDGLAVSPLGQRVIANPGDVLLVCGNDNVGGGDFDANDACAMASFGEGGLFTMEWIGGISSIFNELGVAMQPNLISQYNVLETFFYTAGTEPIFKLVSDGRTFYSGWAGVFNPGGIPAFYVGPPAGATVFDVETPEPSTMLLIGFGLIALTRLRPKGQQ